MKRLFLTRSPRHSTFAQGVDFVRANYTKYEYRIPMRDGKKLFTSSTFPRTTSEKWPIMFDRTPYSVAPYGIDNYRGNLGPSRKSSRMRNLSSSIRTCAAAT